MPGEFTSKSAVDPKRGYDASKLRGKSVVVTGGKYSNGDDFLVGCLRSSQEQVGWAKSS